jgi:hypothetical protein
MSDDHLDEPFAARLESTSDSVKATVKRLRPGTPEFVAYLRSLAPRRAADGRDDGHIGFNHPRIGRRD